MVNVKVKDGTEFVVKNGKLFIKKSVRAYPFPAILTLIFVIAKLTGHFDHSWWIVFLPVAIGPVVLLTVFGAVVGVGLLALCGIAIVLLVCFIHDVWAKRQDRKNGFLT